MRSQHRAGYRRPLVESCPPELVASMSGIGRALSLGEILVNVRIGQAYGFADGSLAWGAVRVLRLTTATTLTRVRSPSSCRASLRLAVELERLSASVRLGRREGSATAGCGCGSVCRSGCHPGRQAVLTLPLTALRLRVATRLALE